MRLWSLHPRYLDPAGLVALWREGLLAQAVLAGETRGYRSHPQLTRFREQADPIAAIATYLEAVAAEAQARGYSFDRSKIREARTAILIAVSDGQLAFEWSHLREKLQRRNLAWYARIGDLQAPLPHPLFFVTAGSVAVWERGHPV